jgi:hypothetical protein
VLTCACLLVYDNFDYAFISRSSILDALVLFERDSFDWSVYLDFCSPDVLRNTQVRPTVFLGVPRVWEKMMEKMVAVGAQTQGLKVHAVLVNSWRFPWQQPLFDWSQKRISTWAKSTGRANGERLQRGESTTWGYSVADAYVM